MNQRRYVCKLVSRDSIRIASAVAALNDLEVLNADISGAYLNAKGRRNFTLLRVRNLDLKKRVGRF
jgi:hypothetical protein